VILVAGSRGFIGQHVVAHLQSTGRPFRELDGDVRDAANVTAAAQGCSAIIHLAFKNLNVDGKGFDTNIVGTQNAVNAARQVGARLVSMSTAGVYGHGSHSAADEDTAIAPDTDLSRSRAEADQVIIDAHSAGLPAVILRQRFVYGPGDQAVLPRIHRVASRSPIWVDGGRARLSLVFVDDLAMVLVRATTEPLSELGPVFHVTDGQPVLLRELGERLCDLLGGVPPRFSVPMPIIHGPVRLWERIRGVDPETSDSAVSSIRLKLAAQDQVFVNDRLCQWMPDLRFTPLTDGLAASQPWYASLLTAGPPESR